MQGAAFPYGAHTGIPSPGTVGAQQQSPADAYYGTSPSLGTWGGSGHPTSPYDPDPLEAELRSVGVLLARQPRGSLNAAFSAALDAIARHVALLALLRGALPAGLGAPLPPAYVARRVAHLAVGTCVDSFCWDGGDPQVWSPELPDDSSLLLYLTTSFLLCPGWNFTAEHAGLTDPAGAYMAVPAAPPSASMMFGGASPAAMQQQQPAAQWSPYGVAPAPIGRGGPLFVGALPPASRRPERYAAVLVAPMRPPEGAIGALCLACARAAPPRFHVYATGTELAVTSGHNGLFHALVLFFLAAEQLNGGALGPARLESPAVALASIFTEPGARL